MHALQVRQVAQNEDMENAARQIKTALATFYVYVVFLACYLPISGVRFAEINGETVLLSHLEYFTFTLVFLNSSLNPLIYCWKMRYIRQTVMEILRNCFVSCGFLVHCYQTSLLTTLLPDNTRTAFES